ncbi:MAG: VOC family protein [Pseudomonadota bacterium]
MEVVQSGVVLKTENYEACEKFYREALGLPVLFVENHDTWNITCFEVGGGYLMVETGGVGAPPQKSFAQSPVKLRFNVTDLEGEVEQLRARGFDLAIQHHAWGSVAEFCDPDGNRIALRQDSEIYRRTV